jgi:hypothetical protein
MAYLARPERSLVARQDVASALFGRPIAKSQNLISVTETSRPPDFDPDAHNGIQEAENGAESNNTAKLLNSYAF